MLGKLIASGKTRIVYEHANDPSLVVKRAKRRGSHHNETEWRIWRAVKGSQFERLFCPCVELLDNGDLLMRRCGKVRERGKRITIHGLRLADSQKPANLGTLDGRVVLLDYGHGANKPLIDLLYRNKEKQCRLT